jgi:hypothetical protein
MAETIISIGETYLLGHFIKFDLLKGQNLSLARLLLLAGAWFRYYSLAFRCLEYLQ